jgi:ABC-2 type transport system permease protein
MSAQAQSAQTHGAQTQVARPVSGVRKHAVDNGLRLTFPRVLASEWIKFWSVRTNVITLASVLVIVVGLGALFASFAGSDQAAAGPAAGTSDPLQLSLSAFSPGQLVIGVLGVLVASSEYATGMIRTTFASVPHRLQVLTAKALVVGVVSFAVGVVGAALAVQAGSLTYGGDQAFPAWGDEEVLQAVFGLGLYLAGIAVIAMALGFLLRGTASAVGVLVVGLLLAPGLAGLLPDSVSDAAARVLPSNLGASFATPAVSMGPGDSLLSSGVAVTAFIAWVIGLLALAGVQLRRRDA